MTDLFISYASEDRKRVKGLVDRLEKQGWSVWWDREIETGTSFDREIERAIDSAKCILVVWSMASVESEWVRTEANEGLDRGILIPVTIDDVRPPLAYRRLQTTFLPGWPEGNHEDELLRLTASITKLLGADVSGDADGAQTVTGERRNVSVLTGRITSHLGARDPEMVDEVIQEFRSTLDTFARRFGGLLYHAVGNNFVVVFGIPSAHETDTLLAVRLALQLQSWLKDKLAKPPGGDQTSFTVENCITSGLVIARKEKARTNEYSLTGHIIDEGTRLLDAAEPNDILATSAAHGSIASYVEATETSVSNQPAYRIKSTSAITSRLEAAEVKGFTDFCGRESELGIILEKYNQAVAGAGQVVTISGEAGIGKSRLLHEAQKQFPGKEIFLLIGRCQSHAKHTPYYPYLGMLRHYLGLNAVPAGELHDTAVEAIRTVYKDLEKYIPHYLYLLSIPSERYRLPAHMEGEGMRLALQDALVGILTVATRQRPLVLVLEDWHWADAASTGVLQHLIHVAVSFPMLIIISCRTEFQPGWASLEHSSLIRVVSIPPDHTRAMISSIAGADEIPVRLVDDLHHRTGGNPFFIEELCYSLLEQGKIYVRANTLVMKDGAEQLELPDSVQAVLRTRLDQLDREAQEIIHCAAVIGREFSRRLLELTTGKMVDPVLRGLIEAGIVKQTQVFPDQEFIFKHALIQVVAYETLLIKQRRKLHQLVAKNIMSLYPATLDEHTEDLAHHFSLSDDIDSAIQFSLLAGERALARSAHRESLKHLKNAEQMLESAPDDATTQKYRLRTALSMAPALVLALGYSAPEVVATYQQATEYSKMPGAEDAHFAASWGLWRYHNASGLMEQATRLAYQLLEIAKKSGKREQLISAYGALVVTETYNGNLDKALGFLPALRASHDPDTERELARRYGLSPMALGLGLGASASLFAGDYSQAVALNEEAIKVSKDINHSGSEVMTLFYYVSTLMLGGEAEKAFNINKQLLVIAEAEMLIHWIALGKFNEARDSLMMGGDIREKVANLLERANTAAMVAPASISGSMVTLATVFLMLGQPEKSLEFIARGMQGLELFKPELLRLKAKILAKSNPTEALATIDKALELANEKNNIHWKIKILMDRIPMIAGQGSPVLDDVRLLKETIASFSGDIEIPEVNAARKYLNELKAAG